ncbi:MAG: ACP S-malonyltransferase [Clostridiales bacterium]|nr:ACP S-malonyltransferase [Clostridiales bacterium]
MNTKKNVAVLFAGQGAQKPGMGFALYEASAAARKIFDLAGEETLHDCFHSDADHLKETEVTQPAVYTVDLACFAALCEALGKDAEDAPFAAFAGFSLGEYAAFAAAGVFGPLWSGGFETGLSLVKTRSRLMKEAGRYKDGSPRGAMAAAMGDPGAVVSLVSRVRGDDVLEAVNFNSPAQTVIAGDLSAVERFTAAAKKDRSLGVKAVPLPVSGAFHTPIMAPAARGLEAALTELPLSAPQVPVFLNVTGSELSAQSDGSFSPERLKETMVRQIQSPVQWRKSVEAMAAAGVSAFAEAGPGKTLSGLVKKTLSDAAAYSVEDTESLMEAVTVLKK